jgi:transcription elongation factor Elf1
MVIPMSKRTITGVGMPAIEECPECGSYQLAGTTIEIKSSMLGLDGHGGVAEWRDDVMQDALIISLDCRGCGVALIEDAESVHEEVDV